MMTRLHQPVHPFRLIQKPDRTTIKCPTSSTIACLITAAQNADDKTNLESEPQQPCRSLIQSLCPTECCRGGNLRRSAGRRRGNMWARGEEAHARAAVLITTRVAYRISRTLAPKPGPPLPYLYLSLMSAKGDTFNLVCQQTLIIEKVSFHSIYLI